MVTDESPVLLKISGISESVLLFERYIKLRFIISDAFSE